MRKKKGITYWLRLKKEDKHLLCSCCMPSVLSASSL